MPGRRTLLFLPLLATALLSCADLPNIEENTCGNGFIERGEDCDYFTPPPGNRGEIPRKATCNLPGTANECRWQCDQDPECQTSPVVEGVSATTESLNEGPVKDGSGWSCGSDHVCRHPQGFEGGRGRFFEPVGNLVPGSTDELFTGDFDGDRRKDVLAKGQAGFDIHYFASDGSEAKSISLPAAPVTPAIGKLTTSAADDFTLDVGRGTGVMLGGLGATIDPTSYLSLDIAKRYGGVPPDDMRVLILDSGRGPRPVAMASIDGDVQVIEASANPKGDLSNVFLEDASGFGRKKLLGSIPVSFLEDPQDRQRFLLAYQGEPSVAVVDIVPVPGTMKSLVVRSNIALPAGFTVHGAAFFHDINSDGLLDVVVGAAKCDSSAGMKTCSVAELDVAYGDGKGAFYSLPKAGPTWDVLAKGKAAPYLETYPNAPQPSMPPSPSLPEAEIEQLLPLAVGRLNSDSDVDYVTAFGIYISNSSKQLKCFNEPNGYCRAEQPSVGGAWSEASIADFNADGRADVVGVSPGIRGIDFFNGTGTGVFNTFSLPTEGAPRSLAVGDFDGDLVADFAFDSVSSRIDKASEKEKLIDVHKLFVSFGGVSGAPAPPADMGEVPDLLRLVAGNVSSLGHDAAADLVLVSGVQAKFALDTKDVEQKVQGHDWKVGLSLGNGYRQLQAPLVFFSPGSIAIHGLPLASAIGAFDSPASKTTSGHTDLAALIMRRASTENFDDPPKGSPLCDFAAELWLLPATGEARIEPPADASPRIGISATLGGPLTPLLPIRRLVEAVPIRLDGGGEGLVIALPSYTPTTCGKDLSTIATHGELYFAKFDATGAPTVTRIVASVGPNEFLVHLRVGDVDGDGHQDIVALRTTRELDIIQPLHTSVVMLHGDGKGSFEGPVDVPIQRESTEGVLKDYPIDIALVNADGNRDPEIVVVAELQGDGQGAALFVIDWDKASSSFKTLLPHPTEMSPNVGTGSTTPLKDGISSVLEGPKAIAGGDFDGDGVDDIVVAVAGGIRLLKGAVR